MFRFKASSDAIQMGILLAAVIALLGGFWSYCEGHFAKSDALNSEIEERRELKVEVDSLYLHLIPEQDRIALKYHNQGDHK